jgi:GTP-binding protein HflX
MNSLTDADVLAEDKLFATLDTRTRRWSLPKWGPVLLSDTVGFIRDLPHSLIASFKATLEETRQADLLLHVADASNPNVIDQIHAVYGVLQEIGIEEKDTLLILNKVDDINDISTLDSVLNRYPNAVPVSAKTKLGFEKMHSVVSDALSRSFQNVDIEMSVGNGKLLAYLAAKGEILSTQYSEDMVKVHCRLPQKYLGKIDPTDTIVTPHSPAGWLNEDEEQSAEDADSNPAGNEIEQSFAADSDMELSVKPEPPKYPPVLESTNEVDSGKENGSIINPIRTMVDGVNPTDPTLPIDDVSS